MAQMINLTIFEGYLGGDAEVKDIGNGRSVVNYRVASTRRFKLANGEPREETTWMNVVDWKPSAVNLAKYLTKGRPIKVVGRLQSRSYEDKQGNKRTAIDLLADEVLFGREGGKEEGGTDTGTDWASDEETDTKPW